MPRLLVITTIARTMDFLLPFARHFRAQGWHVDGMASGISTCQKAIDAFDQVWEAKWSRNPLAPSNTLDVPRELLQIVDRGRYDLVHVHTPVAAFVSRCTLRFLRRSKVPRIVYTAHGFHFCADNHSPKNYAFLCLEKLAGNWTDYLVVMNLEDDNLARKYRLLPADRIINMPGIGLDTQQVAPEQVSALQIQAVRRELGLSGNDVLFSMLAALEPRKRHHDVLNALAALRNPNIHLALAGEGPLCADLKRRASELGVSGQVHFLGQREDVAALIRTSVATLLPSAREGLSRSVMESLSLAVPVIGTNVKGVQDLLASGAGLLVNVGDIDGLAGAMAYVAEHTSEACVMGATGRRQMAAHDIRHILRSHEELYERALSQ